MKRLIAFALFACSAAFAQNPATCSSATIPICTPGSPSGDVQIKPQAVPTSSTIVTTYDAYLRQITVTNTTAGALTFTLRDRQGTPIAALEAVSIAANTAYVVTWPAGYWCPSGFTVIASGSGLNMYGNWKQ